MVGKRILLQQYLLFIQQLSSSTAKGICECLGWSAILIETAQLIATVPIQTVGTLGLPVEDAFAVCQFVLATIDKVVEGNLGIVGIARNVASHFANHNVASVGGGYVLQVAHAARDVGAIPIAIAKVGIE